jgi:NADH-quinone oxidoreductase subunit L
MGVPPFAGFWSKDEIIATAYNTGHYAIWIVALLTAFYTALYMTRAVVLTVSGSYRGTAPPHESPPAMTAPMILLAGLSIGAGFFGGPLVKGGFNVWVHVAGSEAEAFSWPLGILSVAVAAAGIGLGWVLYRTYRERDPILSLGPAYGILVNKYFMDDIYDRGVVRPIQYPVANAVNAFDRSVIDGAVNGVGMGARGLGGALRYIQSGNVQRYAVFLFAGVAILAFVITRL